MVERSDVQNIEWINEIEWNDDIFSQDQQKAINVEIKKHYQSIWDDYGKIGLPQLSDAFDELSAKVPNFKDYTVIACFHHHFYPFPENYNKIGDRSLMRNFDDVIKKLQRYNVKVVLHGHKHLPMIGPITNKEYLSNPDSVMYVFSTGSVAKKDADQSFQIIDVYSPKENKIATVQTFNYKLKDLSTKKYSIPPEKKHEHIVIEILETFSDVFPEEYHKYKNEIKDSDNVSSNSRIDEIIKNIGRIITPFERVRKNFLESYEINLIILLAVHYRINSLNKKRNSSNDSEIILVDIKKHFQYINITETYKTKLFEFLDADENSKFENCYTQLEKNSIQKEKIFTAYTTVAVFFTDLYLTLRQYGEFYYQHDSSSDCVKFRMAEIGN